MAKNAKEINDLARELAQEAYFEGHDKALYDHAGNAFHTVEKHQDYLNHKRIVEKIRKEIAHLLEEKEFRATGKDDEMKKLYKFNNASYGILSGPPILLDLEAVEAAHGQEFIVAGKNLWLPHEEAERLNALLEKRVEENYE